MTEEVDQSIWEELSKRAWRVRENACLSREDGTKVGAALYSSDGTFHSGCNVETRYRSNDQHAERNAIGSMVSMGSVRVTAILIAAKRDWFSPCGGCMDWLMQFGGEACLVGVQRDPQGKIEIHTAHDFMPLYPR